MSLQDLITKIGIESADGLAQAAEMLTAHDIREELIRQLDSRKIKGADVARTLSIAPARVTEMRRRDRKVQQEEMEPLASLLGMVANEIGERVATTTKIENWGKVAQGVWLEQSEIIAEDREMVAYDRLKGDAPPTNLFAVTPEGSSMNLRFLPGTQLICRKVPFGSGEYKSGDYVIAQRSAHDLVEMTAKRLEIDSDGNHWLHSESSDDKYKEAWSIGRPDEGHHDDTEVIILAKVIRAVQDFERAT